MKIEAKQMLQNLTSKIAIKISLLLVVGLLASTALGQQRPASASSNRASQQSDAITLFRSARDLITDGEWAKAQEKFTEYVNSYPNEKNIDAALYWLAYSQHKLGKYDQARATIDRLVQKYPNSSWRDDARVLLVQVPGNYAPGSYAMVYQEPPAVADVRGVATVAPVENAIVYAPAMPPSPLALTPLPAPLVWGGEGFNGSTDSDDPCEFKIVVLQALFQTDLQRGIMAATDWLKAGSTQTVRCKSAALTLLGRSGGKAVTPVILGVARSEPDLKLRARAIAALGATNDDTVVDALRDFALNSQENDIIEASVYALSRHTGDRAITVLSDIAVSGKTPTQRKFAISSIASRPGEPAVDALFRIYDADQNIEIRKAVISGFANRKSERAGSRLVEIARSSDNIELRKAAISGISRRGDDKAVEFLLSLYDTEKNEELKDQIINSLGSGTSFFEGTPLAPGQGIGFNTSNRMNDQRVVSKLIEIAKSPQAPMERRKRAIGWLSRSKDPQVLKFLEELLR
jgi:tetratricopeptide (TPR) repeat protein